jgi:hypothetical protein
MKRKNKTKASVRAWQTPPIEEGMAHDVATPGDALEGMGIVDIAAGEKEAHPLDERTALEILTLGGNAAAVMDDIHDYAEISDVEEDFAERQNWNVGSEALWRKLHEHHSESPQLSGGDVDAAWDMADEGDETISGMAPTPDQDIVEEIGQGVGLTYRDDEPLHTLDKLQERDRHRWELDPDSVEEEE